MNATPELFIEQSRQGLAEQTSAHASTWHLGEEESWNADLDEGTLCLNLPGSLTASAQIQVVGTYDPNQESFMWGWDHPSVPEPLRSAAVAAKEWGTKHNQVAFTARKVQCSLDEAWSFAAVANRLVSGNGVYRGSAGPAYVFMTFGEVKLEKRAP